MVASYVDKPDNCYWREQVPGTKRYLLRLLPNARTIEEALEECIEAFTARRQEQAAHELTEDAHCRSEGDFIRICFQATTNLTMAHLDLRTYSSQGEKVTYYLYCIDKF